MDHVLSYEYFHEDKGTRLRTLRSIHPVVRIVLLIILNLVSSVGSAVSQQASTSAPKPNPAPTPIPLAEVPFQAQSALASLQEIEADVARDQASADAIAHTVSNLTGEIDASLAENTGS